MTILYYTVEIHLQPCGCDVSVKETTGWKTIRVYIVEDSYMKLLGEIEAENETSSITEIQTWLDNNGNEQEYIFDEL